jgi:diadenosine tetraphosphate (Ap4A) HIT family hydrolase
MIIAGFEVPHMHIHLIPANTLADLDFARAATSVEVSELEGAAELIKSALES